VETREDFFVEGAWDGPFDEGGLLGQTTMLGSGGRIAADTVAFSAASHVLERLHLIRARNAILVSNSLPFLLAEASEEIDLGYPWYEREITSVTLGLSRAQKTLPLASGNRVHLLYACDVFIDQRLRFQQKSKVAWEEFSSYAEYRAFLDRWISSLAQNAAAESRSHPYRSLATLSSGYDSPACAVLARESAGCEDAVTFRSAREGFDDLDDSGEQIGALLGFNVTQRERTRYLTSDGFPEAEFVACGTGGPDVVFQSFEDSLPGRLFFTGYFGDTVWGLTPFDEKGARDLECRNAAGASLMEFRLRVGFIHFPLPQAHQPSRPSIEKISNSAEMAGWRVGGEYDRPIPRRILEEEGVPRGFFGQSKKAVTEPLRRVPDLNRVMNGMSYADFKSFSSPLHAQLSGVLHARARAMRTLYRLNLRINWRFRRWLGYRKSILTRPIVNRRYESPLMENAWLFHWGVEKLLTRYGLREDSKRD
jgi:hypothetical protein